MKQGLKVLVSVLLLLNLTLMAYAAGAGEKGFSNKELTIAAFQGAYGRDYWDAVAAEFMKAYPGTTVTVQADPQIGNQIRPQVVAGNPPDVIYLGGLGEHSGVTSGLIKEKGLVEFTDVFNGKAREGSGTLKDSILPGVLDTLTCSPYGDGKVFIAPYNYSVMGLWYNKNFFDTNKITPPKTWDEFFALNDVAKKYDRALFTYQGIYPGYLEEMVIPALYAAGGKETVKKFTTYQAGLWTSDAALKVLGIFEKIATTDNMLMKGTVALNHTQSQTAFMQGKAMFIVNGSWFESEMKDAPREEGFQFGYLGVPAFKAGDPLTSLVSIEGIYVPAKAKNVPLAKELIRFLYTKKSIELNAEKAKGVFAAKGAVELAKPFLTVSTYNCFKAVEGGMVSIEASLAPMAKGSKINISDEIYNPFSSVMNGELTAKQYAERLDALYATVRDELSAAGQ